MGDDGRAITEGAHHDRLAIARAFALLPLLFGIKLYLYFWYRRQGVDALAETRSALCVLLLGPDVLLCAMLAPVHRALVAARAPGFVAALALHAALVVVCAVNVRVNQVFGQPLSCDLLAYANDLSVMRDSIWASVDAPFLFWLVAGVSLFFTARGAARVLGRVSVLRARGGVWALAAVAGLGMGFASFQAFRGVYNYGLKSNPILELARTYRTAPNEASYAAQRAELSTKLAPEGGAVLSLASLDHPEPVAGLPALAGAARGMNLVLLLLESTPDRYVDERTAPNLARLRAEGLRVRDWYTTAPFTFDAQFALFYSQPIRGTAIDPPRLYGGPPRDRSLFESFRARGYDTAIFHASFIQFHSMRWLFQGKGVQTLVSADDIVGAHPGWSWGAREEDVVDRMVAWLGEHHERPFFAVYNPVCPHHPYHSPGGVRPFPGKDLESTYRNALHYTDENVGRLLDALRAQGLAERTVIVAVSDHGETVDRFGGGHGLAFTTDELRVPFIVHAPAVVRPVDTRALSANHLDFAPTMSALFGLDGSPEWLGRDLLAAKVDPRVLYVGLGVGLYVGLVDHGVAAVRSERDGSLELFDARGDALAPLAKAELDPERVAAYERATRTLDDKVRLRHLERAAP